MLLFPEAILHNCNGNVSNWLRVREVGSLAELASDTELTRVLGSMYDNC
jgi:hypothetical protein